MWNICKFTLCIVDGGKKTFTLLSNKHDIVFAKTLLDMLKMDTMVSVKPKTNYFCKKILYFKREIFTN